MTAVRSPCFVSWLRYQGQWGTSRGHCPSSITRGVSCMWHHCCIWLPLSPSHREGNRLSTSWAPYWACNFPHQPSSRLPHSQWVSHWQHQRFLNPNRHINTPWTRGKPWVNPRHGGTIPCVCWECGGGQRCWSPLWICHWGWGSHLWRGLRFISYQLSHWFNR